MIGFLTARMDWRKSVIFSSNDWFCKIGVFISIVSDLKMLLSEAVAVDGTAIEVSLSVSTVDLF